MKLDEYLKKTKQTRFEFAYKTGVSLTSLYNYLNQVTLPTMDNAKRIVDYTNGIIDYTDLVYPIKKNTDKK